MRMPSHDDCNQCSGQAKPPRHSELAKAPPAVIIAACRCAKCPLRRRPRAGDLRPRDRSRFLLKEQVLQKHGKALVIYGAVHFYRTFPRDILSSMGDDIGIARTLEIDFPGRTFVVIPVGRLDPPRGVTAGIDPDFQKFDRALKTQVRPVLVSLQRLPFRDFTAEEFLGRTLTTCRGAGGCVSVFQGSSLTLGQMADACVYVGGGADVDSKAKPTQ